MPDSSRARDAFAKIGSDGWKEPGGITIMDVYCGIDWAEDHHDIALVDRDGQLLAHRRRSGPGGDLVATVKLAADRTQIGCFTSYDPVPSCEVAEVHPGILEEPLSEDAVGSLAPT